MAILGGTINSLNSLRYARVLKKIPDYSSKIKDLG